MNHRFRLCDFGVLGFRIQNLVVLFTITILNLDP